MPTLERSSEVIGLALMQAGGRLTLGVAHANGHVHHYDATTGHWLAHLRVSPNVADIVAAPRFVDGNGGSVANCVCVVCGSETGTSFTRSGMNTTSICPSCS